jgi:D-serine deaminase-like pyridoxal phosphate-dependent protein
MIDILKYFEVEDVGNRVEDLETPVPIIDVDVVERNLKKWQARCDAFGITNRPHIKTHKLVGFAKYQIDLGARGITVQKLGEAEVMADAGITDILLTFNVLGKRKLERLAALAKRTSIIVVADNEAMLEGLSYAGQQAGRKIGVLVECDTGAHRNGVQSPQHAAALARLIDGKAGLRFDGLMTYPPNGGREQSTANLLEAFDLLKSSGLQTKIISTGGSPDMWKDEGMAGATEYRAGTYIYFDRSLAMRNVCTYDDCALHVLSTVVSRPTEERAMIDAGSKSLTSDLMGMEGFGVVPSLNFAPIYNMSEEHGFVDISKCAAKPSVGDVLRIVPNHVCPVSNLFDKVVLVRGENVIGAVSVNARGKVA